MTSAQMVLRPAGRIVLVGLLGEQMLLLLLTGTVCNGLAIMGLLYGSVQACRKCLDLMGRRVTRPSALTGSIEELLGVSRRLDEGGCSTSLHRTSTAAHPKSPKSA